MKNTNDALDIFLLKPQASDQLKRILDTVIERHADGREFIIKAPGVGVTHRSLLVPETRAVNEAARSVIFTSSTEAVDRYGDVIRVAGWDFKDYLKNPVFLWGHKSDQPPIGKTTKIGIESNPSPALVQEVQFADGKTSPFADQIFKLYQGGFLNAVSVGFRPTTPPKPRNDSEGNFAGWEFNGQTLLELSAVPIPANAGALARAMDEGVITAETRELFKPPSVVPGVALARRILTTASRRFGTPLPVMTDAEAVTFAETAFDLIYADALLAEEGEQ